MEEIEFLNSLREKEKELDSLIQNTKLEAQQIKERAVKTAEDMKNSFYKEIKKLKEKYIEENKIQIEREREAIIDKARKEAEYIKNKGLENIKKGVELVIKAILP